MVGGAERLPGEQQQQQGSLPSLLLLSETKNSETKDPPLAATVRKGREEKQKTASRTSGRRTKPGERNHCAAAGAVR